MAFSLPKIYPITDVSISGLSHLEQVKRLIRAGAEIIQLRDKTASSKDFYESARAVVDFARKTDVKIIINDRVDIALLVKADGVHLGQDDLPPQFARQILGETAIIGFSTHSVSQAIAATKLPIDYLAYGPIYTTTTKKNPDPIVGIRTLQEVRLVVGDFPLAAIGGINSENFKFVLQNGADSVALISQIWSEPQKAIEIFRHLVKHCSKL